MLHQLRLKKIQKTTEATVDLLGNRIVDKFNSAGKSKEGDKTRKIEKIYIPSEKKTGHY